MNTNNLNKRNVSSPDAKVQPDSHSDEKGRLTASARDLYSRAQKSINNMVSGTGKNARSSGCKKVVAHAPARNGIQPNYHSDDGVPVTETRYRRKTNEMIKHGRYTDKSYSHPNSDHSYTGKNSDVQPIAAKDATHKKSNAMRALIAAFIILLCIGAWALNHESNESAANVTPEEQTPVLSIGTEQPTEEPAATEPVSFEANVSAEPDESPINALKASATSWTDPNSSLYDLEYGVYVGTSRDKEYNRDDPIYFGTASAYTDLEGVITFRGSNMRQNAFYGTAELSEKKLSKVWQIKIGNFDTGWVNWTGVGWNGQPVIVKWPAELRRIMNLYDEYKNDEDLVEVIQGALDGKIYFLDLYTGNNTRDPIDLGYPIKGSVSIDPRGYPLLYVGQGISKVQGQKAGKIGWHVYSLIDQSHLYLLDGRDELCFRTDHGSFDGVCLIDAETDTAITGGENGIFYTIKLNTLFDINAGTISIDPEVTRYRYKSKITKSIGSEGLGIENSVAAYGNYAWFADNAGQMTCLDLNTLKPVWVFNLWDDTDATTALEDEGNGVLSLYTLNQVDKQGAKGICTVRKLNALTGEELWSFDVNCKSDGENGGGGFASPAIGANGLSDYVYFNVARTSGGSTLYCVNKKSGKIKWQKTLSKYSWSTPVLIYDNDGDGYLIVGNSGGVLRLYGGNTGKLYDELQLDGIMEASPAVFNNMLVIGTRSKRIYGVKIK